MARVNAQNVPKKVVNALLGIEDHLKNSGFDVKFLELIRFRISQINQCAYCLDMHYKIAVHHGESPQRLYSLNAWRETDYYSEREKAALALAERLTQIQSAEIPDEMFAELRKHFSEDEIANLCIVITQINVWNRVTKVFDYEAGSYQLD